MPSFSRLFDRYKKTGTPPPALLARSDPTVQEYPQGLEVISEGADPVIE